MDQQIINISIDDISSAAMGYFAATAGLKKDSEKHRRMWAHAMRVYEEFRQKAEIKVFLRYLVPGKIDGKNIYFNGIRFSCNAFERFTPDNINGAYFYLLTVGDAGTDSEQLMDQLYADIWGTSLVDSANDKIRGHISFVESEKEKGNVLSAPFGPGYYGMALGQTVEFFQIVDAPLVGVTLTPGGMMLPQKSVTGLYLSVKDGSQLPPGSCENCIGGVSGCAFCNRSDVEKPT